MSAGQTDDVAHIAVSFRSESADESIAWGNVGKTALEQVEAEMQSDGLAISTEPRGTSASEGTRGFADALLVNVAADAIITVLVRVVAELILRWQRRRPSHPSTTPAGAPSERYHIRLRAGDKYITISSEVPEQKIYEQLSLWMPNVLQAGGVTFELPDQLD